AKSEAQSKPSLAFSFSVLENSFMPSIALFKLLRPSLVPHKYQAAAPTAIPAKANPTKLDLLLILSFFLNVFFNSFFKSLPITLNLISFNCYLVNNLRRVLFFNHHIKFDPF